MRIANEKEIRTIKTAITVLIISASLLLSYLSLTLTCEAVYVYKYIKTGKTIKPGYTTKDEVLEVLGEPTDEIGLTTFKYKANEEGIEGFIIEYKEKEQELVVDRMDIIFAKPFKSEALAKSMEISVPSSGKINSEGLFEEHFGSDYSVVFIHKTISPKSGVVSVSVYSRELFELLENDAKSEEGSESTVVKDKEDKKGTESDQGTEREKKSETIDKTEKDNKQEVARLSLEVKQHLQQGMTYVSLAKANPKTKDENYNNALLEFSNAIKINPKYAEAYSDRGVVYMQQKKYNMAEKDLKKAAELKPKDPIILYNLAALYSLEKKNDLSLDYLDKALENGFNNFDALKPKGKHSDPDLANLRKDPEFKKVLEKHKVSMAK